MLKRILAFAVFGGAVLCAAEVSPKYQPAASLVERRDASVKHAEQVYLASLAAADRQLITDVDIAIKKAMASTNLDGANELAQIKKDALARVAEEKAESPRSARSASLLGVWKIRSSDGEWLWNIQADKITHEHANAASDTMRIEGESIVAHWPDGGVIRLTPAGGRLLYECWHTGGPTKEAAPVIGVGEHVNK